MAAEYTPAIEDVRDGYRRARYYLDDDAPEDEPYRSGGPEFDRWLAAHDAEVKAEALREHRRRVERHMRPGLVNRATVLADLDCYAGWYARAAETKEAPHV